MINLLATSSVTLLISTALLGLLIGSFLNVVIYRLPVMMQRRWETECASLQTTDAEQSEPADTFNLILPASTCPDCGHKIGPFENIPLLSYLFLKGRCRSCGSPISAQYPLVELITALLSALVAWQLGFSWEMLAALIFTWTLIALTVIDLNTQLLPDDLTLPLLWLGLLLNLGGMFTDIHSSLMGAAAGYLSLWLVYHGFKLVTGKEGMGYGDFKLLAALGAWAGWQALPLIIILSSLLGTIIGIAMIVTGKQQRGTPIPFGPFLAGAGWTAFFWGEPITDFYFQVSGLNP
ncbi:MAG TPA: prepilin peptidase [Gammaproteobacteria bacterium]|nr:prepilin peptidase [Gammaproteobacteria bacterium]